MYSISVYPVYMSCLVHIDGVFLEGCHENEKWLWVNKIYLSKKVGIKKRAMGFSSVQKGDLVFFSSKLNNYMDCKVQRCRGGIKKKTLSVSLAQPSLAAKTQQYLAQTMETVETASNRRQHSME